MEGLKIDGKLYLRCIETCPEDFWTEKDNGRVIIHCRKLEAEHCAKMRVAKNHLVKLKGHS